MNRVIGITLMAISVLIFVVIIAIGAYSVFGWIGLALIVCFVSFISGMLIYDRDYED